MPGKSPFLETLAPKVQLPSEERYRLEATKTAVDTRVNLIGVGPEAYRLTNERLREIARKQLGGKFDVDVKQKRLTIDLPPGVVLPEPAEDIEKTKYIEGNFEAKYKELHQARRQASIASARAIQEGSGDLPDVMFGTKEQKEAIKSYSAYKLTPDQAMRNTMISLDMDKDRGAIMALGKYGARAFELIKPAGNITKAEENNKALARITMSAYQDDPDVVTPVYASEKLTEVEEENRHQQNDKALRAKEQQVRQRLLEISKDYQRFATQDTMGPPIKARGMLATAGRVMAQPLQLGLSVAAQTHTASLQQKIDENLFEKPPGGDPKFNQLRFFAGTSIGDNASYVLNNPGKFAKFATRALNNMSLNLEGQDYDMMYDSLRKAHGYYTRSAWEHIERTEPHIDKFHKEQKVANIVRDFMNNDYAAKYPAATEFFMSMADPLMLAGPVTKTLLPVLSAKAGKVARKTVDLIDKTYLDYAHPMFMEVADLLHPGSKRMLNGVKPRPPLKNFVEDLEKFKFAPETKQWLWANPKYLDAAKVMGSRMRAARDRALTKGDQIRVSASKDITYLKKLTEPEKEIVNAFARKGDPLHSKSATELVRSLPADSLTPRIWEGVKANERLRFTHVQLRNELGTGRGLSPTGQIREGFVPGGYVPTREPELTSWKAKTADPGVVKDRFASTTPGSAEVRTGGQAPHYDTGQQWHMEFSKQIQLSSTAMETKMIREAIEDGDMVIRLAAPGDPQNLASRYNKTLTQLKRTVASGQKNASGDAMISRMESAQDRLSRAAWKADTAKKNLDNLKNPAERSKYVTLKNDAAEEFRVSRAAYEKTLKFADKLFNKAGVLTKQVEAIPKRQQNIDLALQAMEKETGVPWVTLSEPAQQMFDKWGGLPLGGVPKQTRVLIPEPAAKRLEALYTTLGKRNDPNFAQKMMDEVISPIQQFWRISKTSARPIPFSTRNAVSSFGLSTLAFGVKAFDPKLQGQSALLAVAAYAGDGKARQLLSKMTKTMKDGTEVPLDQILKVFEDYGLGSQLAAHQAMKSPALTGGAKGLKAAPEAYAEVLKKTKLSLLPEVTENYQHMVAALGALDDMSPAGIAKAMDFATEYSANYRRIGEYAKPLRDAVGFYSWNAFIGKHIPQQIIKNPNRINGWLNFNDARKKAGEQTFTLDPDNIPPWMEAQLTQMVETQLPEGSSDEVKNAVRPGQKFVSSVENPMSPFLGLVIPLRNAFQQKYKYDPSVKELLGLWTTLSVDLLHGQDKNGNFVSMKERLSQLPEEMAPGMLNSVMDLVNMYGEKGDVPGAITMAMRARAARDWLWIDDLVAKAAGKEKRGLPSSLFENLYVIEPGKEFSRSQKKKKTLTEETAKRAVKEEVRKGEMR